MPRPVTDYDFASWLMYPKVYTDYVADRMQVRRRERAANAVPSSTALTPGEEITVDLERGKHAHHPACRGERRAR